MKINWGTGIVIAFAAFIAFILYFVVIASTDEKAEHDLVTEHYYEKELDFEQELQATENMRLLDRRIAISQRNEGLLLEFPERWEDSDIRGRVQLYRPSSKKLDFELPLQLMDLKMTVPDRQLLPGRWNISIRWEAGGVEYLQQEQLNLVERQALSGSARALKR